MFEYFFDALDARRACEFLEGDGIGFEVRNHSVRVQGVNRFHEGPGIVKRMVNGLREKLREAGCVSFSDAVGLEVAQG